MHPLKRSSSINVAVFHALAIATLVAINLGSANAQAPAINFTYTSLDYPGATATTASGVNNGRVIVGDYTDTSGKMHGYFRTFSGQFASVDYPGATATSLWAINDNNKGVGYYFDASGNTHGFMFALPNIFTPIDYPQAAFTIAYGINNSDQVVGTWGDALGNQTGFSMINNVFTNLVYPNSTATLASGVNSPGNICGIWFDTTGLVHGFTLNMAINGTYTDFDAPGATGGTGADKINDKFQIGGYTIDSTGAPHGLGAAPKINQYVALNYPNATTTVVRGLNNQPVAVGHYHISGKQHGFYAVQSAN